MGNAKILLDFFRRSLKGSETRLARQIDMVIVLAGANLQTPTTKGVVCLTTTRWQDQVTTAGFSSIIALHPFAPLPSGKVDESMTDVCSRFPGFARHIGPSLKRYRSLSQNFEFRGSSGSMLTRLGGFLSFGLWYETLAEIKPKLVVGIGLNSGVLGAAQLLGIPTIEFQHGLLGTRGESLVRYWPVSTCPERSRLIPRLLLTYSNLYTDLARAQGLEAVTIGFPNPEEIQSRHTLKDIESPAVRTGKVLVSLQWGWTSIDSVIGMTTPKLNTAIESLMAEGFSVTLRVHPVAELNHGQRSVRRHLSQRFPLARISFPSETDFRSDLQMASWHLTHSSASVLDAAVSGVPSVVLDQSAIAMFPKELIESGLLIDFQKQENSLVSILSVNPQHRISLVVETDTFSDLIHRFLSN